MPPVVRRSVKATRPYAMAVGMSALAAERDVEVVVVHSGDDTRSGAVAAALGTRVGDGRPGDVLVAVLDAGDDPGRVAAIIGRHRRGGGDAVVALVGTPARRRIMERVLLADPDVEVSVVVHLDRLDNRGVRALRERVVRVLSGRAVAAARRHPPLREVVADTAERRVATRAAVVAALPINAGATMPLLSVMQARLATDIGGLSGGRPDARAAGQAAAVAITAPVWRAVSRRLIRAVPFAATLVRAGTAYTVTRGVAALARRVAPSRPDPQQEER